MAFIFKLYKVFHAIKLLVRFITIALFFRLSSKNEAEYRKAILPWMSYLSAKMLKVFNIQLSIQGQMPNKPHIVVSNHLSYFDILILSAIQPCILITTFEMKETPFLGKIVNLAGCLFVDRANPNNLKTEIGALEAQINKNFNLGLFPEADCMDGLKVYPFRSALFQASVTSKIPIVPICLNYSFVDYEPLDTENKNKIFWFDKSPFVFHVWKGLDIKSIQVDVSILQEITVGERSRKELAALAEAQIAASYRVPLGVQTAHMKTPGGGFDGSVWEGFELVSD